MSEEPQVYQKRPSIEAKRPSSSRHVSSSAAKATRPLSADVFTLSLHNADGIHGTTFSADLVRSKRDA
jgi:hypothetical protein